MPIEKLTTRFLQFNLWATERLTSWLLTLPPEILYTTTGSSFGTIDRTLQHILSGQLYWHAILFQGEIHPFHQPERENGVEQVITDLVASAQALVREGATFTGQQLMESIAVSDSTQSRYEYILHVVNHGTYHRGQIVTMCRALGITDEIPVTDYDAYLWWIENM